VLESQFRFVIDQAPGHHQVAGDPFSIISFERLDLVLGGAVQLLARDIFVDLRRPLTVRAVGAAQVTGVGNPHWTVLGTVAAELARAGVGAVEAAWCALLAVTERLTVVAVTEAAALALALTARTITIRLVLPITVWLAVTVAKGLPVSSTEGFAITGTKGLALTLALTARTIPIRLVLPITKGLTFAGTRGAARAFAAVPIFAGAESARISARVVRSAEGTSVLAAAVTAIVLSHVGFLLL
jgi:hypothetical protein